MSVCLCVVTHARDAAYASLCVRSIERFVSRFARICLFVPEGDLPVFATLRDRKAADGTPVELIGYVDLPERSFLAHQHMKATVDLWVPDCDWFCFCDADTIFIQPTTPAAYFSDDKAILLVASYRNFPKANGECWRNSVAHSLGIEPEHETMQHAAIVHHACTLEDMRHHIEVLHQCSFWQHAMARRFAPDSVTPMNFAEFSTMGSFVLQCSNLRHFYHVVEIESEEHRAMPVFLRQGYSHNWSNPVVHAQELADFGRIIG